MECGRARHTFGTKQFTGLKPVFNIHVLQRLPNHPAKPLTTFLQGHLNQAGGHSERSLALIPSHNTIHVI